MFDGVGGDPPVVSLTLYTDAFVIKGTILTRRRRITDIRAVRCPRFSRPAAMFVVGQDGPTGALRQHALESGRPSAGLGPFGGDAR